MESYLCGVYGMSPRCLWPHLLGLLLLLLVLCCCGFMHMRRVAMIKPVNLFCELIPYLLEYWV